MCVSKLHLHCFRSWLVAFPSLSYDLNQCCFIVDLSLRKKHRHFHSSTCVWKWRLQKVGHHNLAPICLYLVGANVTTINGCVPESAHKLGAQVNRRTIEANLHIKLYLTLYGMHPHNQCQRSIAVRPNWLKVTHNGSKHFVTKQQKITILSKSLKAKCIWHFQCSVDIRDMLKMKQNFKKVF